MNEAFLPQIFFRNPHLQTFLGRSKFRLKEVEGLLSASSAAILDCGEGVRLLGYHSPQPIGQAHGTILLIHGWEGSADSIYIISTAAFFYQRGFAIFRLNLRDHGASHYLNEGLFHGALIRETFVAAKEISRRFRQGPLYIVGFSLGGNFALRLAIKHSREENIPHLSHVFAISPALDPHKATLAIDGGLGVYRRYFLNKWKKSLRKKQALFPQTYDFGAMMKTRSCMELTEAIMIYYRDYRDYRDYFRQYTLRGSVFAGLTVPTTIMISRDDPVIPIEDFYELETHPQLRISVQSYGGHCGFIDMPAFTCWYERQIYNAIRNGRHG